MLSDSELTTIKARCVAATEAPWMVTVEPGGLDIRNHTQIAVRISPEYYQKEVQQRPQEFGVTDDDGYFVYHENADVSSSKIKDAEFIAHCRDDVPKLLETIRELKAKLRDILN